MHDPLGLRGGARGEEDRGNVAGADPSHLLQEEARVAGVPAASGIDQCLQAFESGLGVVAQPPRLVVPDARQPRRARANLQELVDLLLVFDDGEGHLGVLDREDELGGHRVLVQRHRHRAERLHGEHGGVQARPVLADQDDVLAARQPGLGQSAGEIAHELRHLPPGKRLPDPVPLLAHRRRLRPSLGLREQQRGKGVAARHRAAFRVPLHPLFVSAAASDFDPRMNTVPVKVETISSPPPSRILWTSTR